MSSIANLTSAPPLLPPVNVHPHGHKRGSHVESTDSGSDTAAQVPAGAAQNLFGSLLQSLEQVIGVQSAATTPAATATTSAGTTPSTAAAAEPTASAGTAQAQSASALLQNYLNNVSQNLQTTGSQMAKIAGSVKVNA
jgi:hypothetical protein